MDPLLGKDIRGRLISDDVRDFLATVRKEARPPAGGRQRERSGVLTMSEGERPPGNPGSTGNVSGRHAQPRNVGSNGMMKCIDSASIYDTAGGGADEHLNGGTPSTDWAEQARRLKDAYVDELSGWLTAPSVSAPNFQTRIWADAGGR